MKINELEEPGNIDPLKFKEENQEILLKILPPLIEKSEESSRKIELEIYLLERFIANGKTDENEFMLVLKRYGLR
jgi:hypothetical protein